MKLRQLLNKKFYEKQLKDPRVCKDFAFLDSHIDDIFPNQDTINQVVNRLSYYNKKFNFSYNILLLPFHTRDAEWFVNYIEVALSQLLSLKKGEENNRDVLPFCNIDNCDYNYSPYYYAIPVSRQNLINYVKTSPKLAEKIDEYERNVTAGYINNLICANGHNFHMTSEGKEKLMNSTNCDINFRDNVIEAISSLGMHKENIEDSLELNAKVWRKPMMRRAFYNEKSLFSKEQIQLLRDGNPVLFKNYIDKENEYMMSWIRLREHEYCQVYSKIFNRLGLATTDIVMNATQIEEVNEKNQKLDNDYNLVLFQVLNSVSDLESANRKQAKNTLAKGL